MLTVAAARHAGAAFAAALSAGNGACCWCSKNVNMLLLNCRLGWIQLSQRSRCGLTSVGPCGAEMLAVHQGLLAAM